MRYAPIYPIRQTDPRTAPMIQQTIMGAVHGYEQAQAQERAQEALARHDGDFTGAIGELLSRGSVGAARMLGGLQSETIDRLKKVADVSQEALTRAASRAGGASSLEDMAGIIGNAYREHGVPVPPRFADGLTVEEARNLLEQGPKAMEKLKQTVESVEGARRALLDEARAGVTGEDLKGLLQVAGLSHQEWSPSFPTVQPLYQLVAGLPDGELSDEHLQAFRRRLRDTDLKPASSVDQMLARDLEDRFVPGPGRDVREPAMTLMRESAEASRAPVQPRVPTTPKGAALQQLLANNPNPSREELIRLDRDFDRPREGAASMDPDTRAFTDAVEEDPQLINRIPDGDFFTVVAELQRRGRPDLARQARDSRSASERHDLAYREALRMIREGLSADPDAGQLSPRDQTDYEAIRPHLSDQDRATFDEQLNYRPASASDAGSGAPGVPPTGEPAARTTTRAPADPMRVFREYEPPAGGGGQPMQPRGGGGGGFPIPVQRFEPRQPVSQAPSMDSDPARVFREYQPPEDGAAPAPAASPGRRPFAGRWQPGESAAGSPPVLPSRPANLGTHVNSPSTRRVEDLPEPSAGAGAADAAEWLSTVADLPGVNTENVRAKVGTDTWESLTSEQQAVLTDMGEANISEDLVRALRRGDYATVQRLLPSEKAGVFSATEAV